MIIVSVAFVINSDLVNWITITGKSGKHWRATYGNSRQLFQPYYVLSAVYTVISSTEDRTSDYRMQSLNSNTDHLST